MARYKVHLLNDILLVRTCAVWKT